jgi:flagellar biosynthesis GTPase FlhF
MGDNRVFTRTQLGDAELAKPDGKITGDDKRLIMLLDGKTSAEAIGKKIPPSVRSHLDQIFMSLLSARFIAEAGKAEIPTTLKIPAQFAAQSAQETQSTSQDFSNNMLALAEIEIERRIEIEQELEKIRAQLAEKTALLAEADARFNKLRQQIDAYTEETQAKLAEKIQAVSAQANDEKELRASLEDELRSSRDRIEQLNQTLREQQESSDRAARQNMQQAQHNAEQQRKRREAEVLKLARSNEHFNALRGLDFFKAFGNEELLNFLKISKWQKIRAGETVLQEGDVGMSFYIIMSGSVEVTSKGKPLAVLKKGDFFGEFSHLSGESPVRSAQVTTTTDCELLLIEPLDLEFSSTQMRLNVAEAFLRGQIRRSLLANQRISS